MFKRACVTLWLSLLNPGKGGRADNADGEVFVHLFDDPWRGRESATIGPGNEAAY